MIKYRIGAMPREFGAVDTMRNGNHMESGMSSAGDVVRRVANDNRATRIEGSPILHGKSLSDDRRQRKAIPRIRTKARDAEIKIHVKAGHTQFDLRGDQQVSGQDGLDEPFPTQGRD